MLHSLSSTSARVRVAAFLLVAAMAAVAAEPARAAFHVHLLRTDPADSAVVASRPTAIRLWFSGKVELAVTGAAVTAENGAAVSLADPVMANGTDTSAIVFAVKGGMPAGKYHVAWHTAAGDLHPTRGTFSFTIAAPPRTP